MSALNQNQQIRKNLFLILIFLIVGVLCSSLWLPMTVAYACVGGTDACQDAGCGIVPCNPADVVSACNVSGSYYYRTTTGTRNFGTCPGGYLSVETCPHSQTAYYCRSSDCNVQSPSCGATAAACALPCILLYGPEVDVLRASYDSAEHPLAGTEIAACPANYLCVQKNAKIYIVKTLLLSSTSNRKSKVRIRLNGITYAIKCLNDNCL